MRTSDLAIRATEVLWSVPPYKRLFSRHVYVYKKNENTFQEVLLSCFFSSFSQPRALISSPTKMWDEIFCELFVWSLYVGMGFSHVCMERFYTRISHSWEKELLTVQPADSCGWKYINTKIILRLATSVRHCETHIGGRYECTRLSINRIFEALRVFYRWTSGYVEAIWRLIASVRHWEFGIVKVCVYRLNSVGFWQ